MVSPGFEDGAGRSISPSSDLRRLLVVLASALVARVAILVPGFGTLSDPDMYLPLSRSLASGRGFCIWDGIPTANRPPLYPVLLAPIVGLMDGPRLAFGVAALHVALGLGTIALTYATARRWGYGPDRAAVAAAIAAFDPVALVQSRAVMTETLAAFLVAGCLAATTIPGRRGAVLSGLAAGLGALCRPSLLPGAGLVGLAWVAVGPGGRRKRIIEASLFALGLFAILTPWAVRNAIRFGVPIWTTTHGGFTLALANNPAYYADVVDGPPGAVWSGPNQDAWKERVAQATAGMTAIQADRYFRGEGLRMLRERPATFLRASFARLGRFWGVAPSASVYGRGVLLATAAWTVPLWFALAIGLTRREAWRWPGLAAPLLMLGLTAVHTFYWTDMRMRVPIVPAIALVSAWAILSWRKNDRGPGKCAGQIARNR